MSDDVININIEDIAQILATYEIYKPLTFGFFTVFYYLISTERNTYYCCFDDCVFIVLVNSLKKLLWTCLIWVSTHGQVTIYLNPLTKCRGDWGPLGHFLDFVEYLDPDKQYAYITYHN